MSETKITAQNVKRRYKLNNTANTKEGKEGSDGHIWKRRIAIVVFENLLT